MNRVLVLVEGPTERAIFQNVMALDLGAKNIALCPRVVGQPGHKGGNRSLIFSSMRPKACFLPIRLKWLKFLGNRD